MRYKPMLAYPVDMDGDMDFDIVTISGGDNIVGWYENLDGSNDFGEQQIITSQYNIPSCIEVADLDNDADLDIVVAFYVSDMISRLKLPAIIVTRPNLGTINHTLMTVEALRMKKIKITGIIFNYTSRSEKDISIKTNPGIIEELSGVKTLGIMHYNKSRNKRRIRWLSKIGF